MMKRQMIPLLFFALMLSAATAEAACTVQYKAKRDNPLKLEFAAAELPDAACSSPQAAAAALAPQLAQKGWTLLSVVSIVPKG